MEREQLHSLVQKYRSEQLNEKTNDSPHYCVLCNIGNSEHEQYVAHKQGKPHNRMIRTWEKRLEKLHAQNN